MKMNKTGNKTNDAVNFTWLVLLCYVKSVALAMFTIFYI